MYKAAGNPITVSVNTDDLDYYDMHISGSITRHAKYDVTFAIQFTSANRKPDRLPGYRLGSFNYLSF